MRLRVWSQEGSAKTDLFAIMLRLSAHYLLISSLSTLAVQGLKVEFSAPNVITNDVPTNVSLNIVGGSIGEGEVTKIRTVLFRPAKRGPKFFVNVTHSQFTKVSSAQYELQPIYGLPTQEYNLGYSVLVQYEGGKEWIDSDLADVIVEDADLGMLPFISALVLFVTSVVLALYLAVHISPAFWEARLPASMHKYLPNQSKKRTL